MTSVFVLVVLVTTAAVLYALWERADRSRERVVRAVDQDTAALGDVAPASLSPLIDPNLCIGSGACVRACPEKVVIGLVGGRAKLVNPLGCIGHGACEAACPVGAIKLVYGTRTRGVELPRIDPHFQTNRTGVYVIGELGGMGLIRNAVSQGRQAADHVIAGSGHPEAPPRRGVGDALDALVVGAGPAGISTTLRLMEAGLRVLLVEREAFGGTIVHYPRAKVVMTGALDLPLYGRVKRSTMSKEQLVALWQDIQTRTQPPLVTGELVQGLELDPDGMWRVNSNAGTRRAANVLLALGLRGSPQQLGVPGEELSKVAYRVIEPQEHASKHVLVVGGGNSAVESALALADDGRCASVAISYRRAQFARCRAQNRARIDAAIAAGRVRALMESEVLRIAPSQVELRTKDRVEQLRNDAVIVQIGGTPPSALLGSFGIELVTKRGEA
jgi:thioredoxin reductase/NAD-dependent dihydropyrimidine dehydrogenase PreA subunit